MNAKDMMKHILAAEWRIKGVSEVSASPSHDIFNYKSSGWRCELFGTNPALIIHPHEGNVPNAFWRWMQYLCFGNKWIKEAK